MTDIDPGALRLAKAVSVRHHPIILENAASAISADSGHRGLVEFAEAWSRKVRFPGNSTADMVINGAIAEAGEVVKAWLGEDAT